MLRSGTIAGVGVVAVPLTASTRDAAVRVIRRTAWRGGRTGAVAATFLSGGLFVLAGMRTVLMAASGATKPAGVFVLVRHIVGPADIPCRRVMNAALRLRCLLLQRPATVLKRHSLDRV
jgi:hypothetical protein